LLVCGCDDHILAETVTVTEQERATVVVVVDVVVVDVVVVDVDVEPKGGAAAHRAAEFAVVGRHNE